MRCGEGAHKLVWCTQRAGNAGHPCLLWNTCGAVSTQRGGMEQATTIDGVGFFLRALDPQPGARELPTLVISLRAPWLELPVASLVNSMTTVYEGVLNGVIQQMPISAWLGAPCKRLQLTVIVLPSTAPMDRWQTTLVRRTSCWPVRLPQKVTELHPPSKATFIRLRKRGQSKHILGGMKVDWKLINQNLRTIGPTVLGREALYKHLFLNRRCSIFFIFFFSAAERAIKHCRSSGYIRNYDQKDACCTCKTQNQTQQNQHKQNHPTQQRNGTCSRQSEKGETVRHPKRPQ